MYRTSAQPPVELNLLCSNSLKFQPQFIANRLSQASLSKMLTDSKVLHTKTPGSYISFQDETILQFKLLMISSPRTFLYS
jgi:hypothetical protein